MKSTAIICDGCNEVINPKAGMLEFKPLRGGLDLINTVPIPGKEDEMGTFTVSIREHVHLHGPACVVKLIANAIAEAEKKGIEAAAEKKAASKKTAIS